MEVETARIPKSSKPRHGRGVATDKEPTNETANSSQVPEIRISRSPIVEEWLEHGLDGHSESSASLPSRSGSPGVRVHRSAGLYHDWHSVVQSQATYNVYSSSEDEKDGKSEVRRLWKGCNTTCRTNVVTQIDAHPAESDYDSGISHITQGTNIPAELPALRSSVSRLSGSSSHSPLPHAANQPDEPIHHPNEEVTGTITTKDVTKRDTLRIPSLSIHNSQLSVAISTDSQPSQGGVRTTTVRSVGSIDPVRMRPAADNMPFLPFFTWVRAVRITNPNQDLNQSIDTRLVTRVLTKVHRSLCKASTLYLASHQSTADECLVRHPYLQKHQETSNPVRVKLDKQQNSGSTSGSSVHEADDSREQMAREVPNPGKRVSFMVAESKTKRGRKLRIPARNRPGQHGIDRLVANSLALTPPTISQWPNTNYGVQDTLSLAVVDQMEGVLKNLFMESNDLIRIFAFQDLFSDHEVIRRFWGAFEAIARVRIASDPVVLLAETNIF